MRWLLGLFILGVSTAFCFKEKKPVHLIFQPKFGHQNLVTEKNYFLSSANDSISIETLKFYVSGIQLLKKGKTVFDNKNGFYLMNMEDKMDLHFISPTPDFDAIRFNLGIDSTINSGGVKGGDLDPTKNMYWAWQSGYINFKLEGKSKVCKTRNNVFQFHIGGYSYPNNSLQTVTLSARPDSMTINVDIEKFLNAISLQTTNEIMSPGTKAVEMSKLYKSVFEAQ